MWDIRRWPERRYTADRPCGTGLWPCVEPGCFYSAAKRLCETPGSYSARPHRCERRIEIDKHFGPLSVASESEDALTTYGAGPLSGVVKRS